MSDEAEDLKKQIDARLAEEVRLRDLKEKKSLVEEHRVNIALGKITQAKTEIERAKNTNFKQMSQDQIDEKVKENSDYMESARTALKFINNTFDGKIPSFRNNLIFIGAKTGEGKSTAVANITLPILAERKKSDGKLGRVMVITNEEKSEDVYNRVTCLAKGWHYVNHDQFTDEQRATFNEWIPKWAKDGRLTVVDDNYGGVPGQTTTYEGICGIFDNMIANEVWYDAVIIDYYQNIKESKNEPDLDEWKVQAKVAMALDRYKKLYPAPIYILGQVSPGEKSGEHKKETTPFKYRIEGRKVILNVCTVALEMIADKSNFRTEWVIHKSRFNEFIGTSLYTGYEKGKFVPYNEAFSKAQAEMKERRMQQAAMLANVGKDGKDIKPIDDPKKKA